MGRKKDPFWEYVQQLNDKVIKCNFCGDEFGGGASRIKGHLSGIEGKCIHTCIRVPKDVQIAASSSFVNSNKRPFSNINPSNPEHNFVNSNMPSDSSKGNAEHVQRIAFSTIEDFNNSIMRNVNSSHHEVNCFNSNQNIMRNNIYSSDPQENCLNSNQSIMTNIYLGDPEENFLSSNQSVMRNTYSSYLEENFLNSNQSIMRNVNSSYLEDNFLNSNQSIMRNVNSSDSSKGKSITGRKKDRFWQYVETIMDGKVNKCTFCGHEFVGGASRIKWHLSKTEKMGVDICSNVPKDVQKAAYDASNKRLKRNIDPSHIEENFVNSNPPSSSSKGNAELYPMPTSTDFIGKQFQSYTDTIWGWLMKYESVIGVCGMGGVGKTTLLKHIYNKLLDACHHVIWVDVPQDCSVFQLQKAIAESCDLHLLDTDGMTKIAAKLLHAFKKIKKCVIILDDVWDDIHLESVGIPLTNSEVQVIIASRLFAICQTMGCKEHILKMMPLSEYESWDLFFKVLGKDESLLSDEVKDIVGSIREKCDGLPLAIVTMARSMRGKEDIREWKYVLENLRNSTTRQDDMKKSVFPMLTLSYDRLNDKILQECLLLCALYFQFYQWISREDLIMHFVDEGLIDGKKSLEAQFDEGHIILNKLINSNLLLEVNEQSVDVHRLVWAMAAESDGYMVKVSEDLGEVPPEQEWKESLQKVRLTVKEIPSGTSPWCPKLSTLLLNRSYFLELIQDSFFINMPSLKVLNLSYCDGIKDLPTSVSNLESLTSLVLRGCSSLKNVPSLAKLQKLRRLDLSGTAITKLPLGLETLINLRWLNLERTKTLIMSPASVIPKLTNLQVLLLEVNSKSMEVKVADLEGLKVMETISASFCDENEFNAYVRRIGNAQNRRLTSYVFQLLGKPRESWFNYNQKVYFSNKAIVFEGIGNTASLLLPVDMNKLLIEECEEWSSLCDVLSFDDKNNLKSRKISYCKITRCHKLENVFCLSSSCSFCSSVQSLESSRLDCLESLSILCKETNVAAATPWGLFSSLRYLNVFHCHRMKTLLTPGMTRHLQNLETLDVQYCNAMEEIFSSERNSDITDVDIDVAMMMNPHCQSFEDLFSSGTGTGRNHQEEQVADAQHIHHTHATIIKLPKLKSVTLSFLPRLIRVYEGILFCDSLKQFKICKCSNLEVVPQIQPPFHITFVQIQDIFGIV